VRAQHCDALPQLTDGALQRDHVGVWHVACRRRCPICAPVGP
jgi:hypothetical protein